ncbi:unnamed protein product [Bursaphelenchus okinawaensis]|uniref:Amino acid transporter transmembrane domain-containing protein n=1 Tax=Bursaphelenchus okinawaensis TaxID=465554 RepID=A0A811KCD5_9BILA|nr:unnamed protein product [Bursaphelenchus okinawaensis]CAG9099380.1 unnamed protein product [Bursaphelenchus okinawaensis]
MLDEHCKPIFTYDGQGKLVRERGMSWVLTGLFLSGEMAGAGVIALPIAVRSLGFYTGLLFMACSALMATYTATILGKSWLILQKHWPMYRYHCRDPYAQIGYRAYGTFVKRSVEIILNIGYFCCAVLLLVIVSKNVNDAVKQFFKVNFDFCFLAVIVTGVITPFCYLKSPQEFWWAIIIGMLCTLTAVLLSMGGVISDMELCQDTLTVPDFNVMNAFTSMGSILFAYGGHACFPTVQSDMTRPYKFTYSSVLAYTLMSLLYFPLSIVANMAYNNNLNSSVINNLQIDWIQQTVNLLITAHCMFAVIIVINPAMQSAENFLKAPQEFGVSRVVIRSALMLIALVIAETFPEFGPLMGLLGATVVSTTSFLFPVLFYIPLREMDQQLSRKRLNWSINSKNRRISVIEDDTIGTKRLNLTPVSSFNNGPTRAQKIQPVPFGDALNKMPRRELVILFFIFLTSFVIMIVSTISATHDLATASFKMPCYLRWLRDWPQTSGPVTPIYCCGTYSNISRGGCIRK